MQIALGGITHEANSFCPHVAAMADFEARQLLRGEEILAGWRNTATEQAGAMSVFSEAADCCRVIPTLLARALSAAPIREATFRALLNELLEHLNAAPPLDGVLLVLHGAMLSEAHDDASGVVLREVRQVVGPDVPITATLDLHANVTELMVEHATALIGYHTAPHIDMYQAGQTAAHILLDTIRGKCSPTPYLVRLPMILPPENSTHTAPPLGAVIDRALALEASGEILHGGVYPVQPWLDAPDVASSVLVYTDDDPVKAERLATELAQTFWDGRHDFVTELVPPDEAVQRALARDSGMVIFCDSADATTSGSTGDSTAILGAVMRAQPLEQMALLNIVDADAVSRCVAAGVGNPVNLLVGGRLSPEYFEPVAFTGRVKLLSDGAFVFKGPGMRGVVHQMGRVAVVTQGDIKAGIQLVIMERGISQWDPELYRSLGLEPRDARIVQVKSPRAFRAAYEGLFDEVIVVDAPGAASPKLAELPWQRLGRPIYPLDAEVCWP